MATPGSQESGGVTDQSIPQWKRELILRRRALARTLPAGSTTVKLTCPGVVTAVRHPELVAAGENVSGKQQRCISSAVASNNGVLDQTQADFHPRGRINDSSSASTDSAAVVGNMRLVEYQVEGSTDLVINGVGLDVAVEQNSVKYRSRMGEEKCVKISSASRTVVDNCVVNMAKNRFIVSENNNCQHSNDDCESDSSEELQYGPGIVNKLKCKYMSMTLRENQTKGVRPSLSNLRRATSLENMLDNDSDTGKPQITHHRFTKRPDAHNNTSKPEHTSEHQQRYRPTSRRNDSLKRARSVETLLRYDPKSHAATGHSIPSDVPVCDRVVKSEFRDHNKNNTKLLKALGNEEIVIVEHKMKYECTRKTVGKEKVPLFQQKKRTSNIPEETELPPPDVVKQTLKIFEGTPSKKASRLTRAPGVSLKSASYKHGGMSVANVNNIVDEVKGALKTKPLLSPKPVMSPEQHIPHIQSPRNLSPAPLPPDLQHISLSPPLSSRILALDALSSPSPSPLVSPTGVTRLKSPSPNESGRKEIGIPAAPQVEDAMDNIRKDGMSVEFKFGSCQNTKPKSYLPGAKSYLPPGQTSVTSKFVSRNQTVTSPNLERQNFVTTTKSISIPPVIKSADLPQNQMKQVGVIRPIVNNSHSTSPPPSLTDREIEKNFINRAKSIEQPTSKVVVSLKPANEVVVGKVSMEPIRGHTDDSAKSVRDVVKLKNTSDAKGSGLWDSKPWNQPQNTMVFNFSGRKGPVPSYIENDGLILTSRKKTFLVSL
ncbi:hypothetical protein Cfor_10777 [Coptotermes formosanus]|uniref:Uncharacterized protein n=1 Tax=Coptotermes formosanus TaxID=36987 RepID=A0A6L2PUD6_COPFO|nr:hypothetical protein Cfor_10777 [Coptotermes formosanus]